MTANNLTNTEAHELRLENERLRNQVNALKADRDAAVKIMRRYRGSLNLVYRQIDNWIFNLKQKTQPDTATLRPLENMRDQIADTFAAEPTDDCR